MNTAQKTLVAGYVLVGVITFGHASNFFLSPYANKDRLDKRIQSERIDQTFNALFSSSLWPLYWSYQAFKNAPSISIEVKNVQ